MCIISPISVHNQSKPYSILRSEEAQPAHHSKRSILGPSFPDTTQQQPTWFSQPSVRAALHVPDEGAWVRCVQGVFRNRTDGSPVLGDPYSEPPAMINLLSRVIEYTNNVIIGSGGLDLLVPTNGTLLALQNVTWGGSQGFQERPSRRVSSTMCGWPGFKM